MYLTAFNGTTCVMVLKGVAMERVPMTAEGYAHLGAELKRLKTVERPSIIKAISAAREHGDLAENAEYHAARERQSFIEGRVRELEDKMGRAEVIDVSKLSGKQIKFGATVTLELMKPMLMTGGCLLLHR